MMIWSLKQQVNKALKLQMEMGNNNHLPSNSMLSCSFAFPVTYKSGFTKTTTKITKFTNYNCLSNNVMQT